MGVSTWNTGSTLFLLLEVVCTKGVPCLFEHYFPQPFTGRMIFLLEDFLSKPLVLAQNATFSGKLPNLVADNSPTVPSVAPASTQHQCFLALNDFVYILAIVLGGQRWTFLIFMSFHPSPQCPVISRPWLGLCNLELPTPAPGRCPRWKIGCCRSHQ